MLKLAKVKINKKTAILFDGRHPHGMKKVGSRFLDFWLTADEFCFHLFCDIARRSAFYFISFAQFAFCTFWFSFVKVFQLL
jgi:hypothetical protein